MISRLTLPGKTGIRIPSHNSLTASFSDELLKMAATSRKTVDARRIRCRLPEKYHIAIVSTGLSYLAYLGALKKVHRGYKPSRLGRKIGKLLARDRVEEANVAWGELLKRHRLSRVFEKYFSSKGNKHGTLEDFGLYVKKKSHAKWNISEVRSRISRLCELFAEKGLIEYQNGNLSPIDVEQKELEASGVLSSMNMPQIGLPVPSLKDSSLEDMMTKPSQAMKLPNISVITNSWPMKIEIRIEVSDRANSEVIAMILSFLKDLQKTNTSTRVCT